MRFKRTSSFILLFIFIVGHIDAKPKEDSTAIVVVSESDDIQDEPSTVDLVKRLKRKPSFHLFSFSQLTPYSDKDVNKSKIVVVGTIDGSLFGLDAETGEEKWMIQTPDKLFSSSLQAKSSVTSDSKEPVFIPSVDGSNSLFVLTPDEQIKKLPVSVKELVQAAPFKDNSVLYLGSKQTHIYTIDAKTGKLLKSFTSHNNDFFSTTPLDEATDVDTLYIGRADYTIRAIDVHSGKEKWNITTGEFLSFLSGGQSRGLLLQGERDGSMKFIDESGEKIWTFTPPSRAISAFSVEGGVVHKIYSPHPVSSDQPQQVYIGRYQGQYFAVENPSLLPPSEVLFLPDKASNAHDEIGLTVVNPQICTNSKDCFLGILNSTGFNNDTIHLLPPYSNTTTTEIPSAPPKYTWIIASFCGMLLLVGVIVFKMKRDASAQKTKPVKKKKKTSQKNGNNKKDNDLKQKIGKLEITPNILGYGSSGTIVYEGNFDGRKVAVKRMLKTFYKLAHQEISLLLESEHTNVVTYYTKEEDGEFVYLALQYCPKCLVDIIEDDSVQLSREQQLELLKDLVTGIDHLHALNIVHRDIKPQNILVDSKNRLKISDMGLAKKLAVNQSSFSNSIGNGSAGWLAPEMLQFDKQNEDKPRKLNKKLDIFSLGCVMYYVLTKGQHPFGDRFERELNIRNGKYNLDALKKQPEAQHLIKSMIQLDPDDRPSIAEVKLHPFFWSDAKKLQFLRDASDRVEVEPLTAPIVLAIETGAANVVGNDWKQRVDQCLVDNLGKYRAYNGASVRDLLRVIRNKSHHYRDLEELVQKTLGPLPSGFLHYFTSRFPTLLLHTWHIIRANCSSDAAFQEYFHPS